MLCFFKSEAGATSMKRREFLGFFGGAAVSWPLTGHTQQTTLPVVGFLSSFSPDTSAYLVVAFRQGLSHAGYVEGQNVAIDYRWAEGQYDRLPALAAELVSRQVAVIVASGGDPSALAAKSATATIPIVFTATITDPVKLGLVSSLNRPGGNVTGFNLFNSMLNAKRLELLRELAPTAARIGVLVNPTSPTTESHTNDLLVAAHALGLQLNVVGASAERDLDGAFATLVREQSSAILVTSDPFFNSRRNQLVALAAHHALPTIFSLREYAAAGGLMSYGPSLADGYRLAGLYAGQILKGAKPADLPVQQAMKVELVINLKTAKTLGLEVPMSLLMRVDDVIE
jgi:putative ABC transport system substrate-binding protein